MPLKTSNDPDSIKVCRLQSYMIGTTQVAKRTVLKTVAELQQGELHSGMFIESALQAFYRPGNMDSRIVSRRQK